MGREKELKTQFPAVTAAVLGVALAAWFWPGFGDVLVYDRSRILDGEAWRIFTGPFAHFSASHLFWDALVFGAAGIAIELKGLRRFWLVCALSAIVPGLAYLWFSPGIERFGGLSGTATAAVAYLCLWEAGKPGRARRLWMAILVLTAMKIGMEAEFHVTLFAGSEKAAFRVLPSAHVIGLCSALAVYMASRPVKIKKP